MKRKDFLKVISISAPAVILGSHQSLKSFAAIKDNNSNSINTYIKGEIDEKVNTLNTRITAERDAINGSISANVDALNNRITAERDAINGNIAANVNNLNYSISANVNALNASIAQKVDLGAVDARIGQIVTKPYINSLYGTSGDSNPATGVLAVNHIYIN